MKTYWTTTEKPIVEKALNEAKIIGEARKTILRFERYKTTCLNNLQRGMSWEAMMATDTELSCWRELDKLNGDGHNCHEALYWEDWKKYCEIREILPQANVGDHFC